MGRFDREYIEGLKKHASETLALFSNPQKPERERMVVRAFLKCIGEKFSDREIRPSEEEPVDIVFREARFQIMESLGGRKRGRIWRERRRRYEEAKSISDLRDSWVSSEPMSFGDVSRVIAEELTKKAARYGPANCSKLDALVYVNLAGRHMWPLEPGSEGKVADELNRQNWRSVSMLFLPYGAVLTTKADAPDFLRDRLGRVLSEWPKTDGWFDPEP